MKFRIAMAREHFKGLGSVNLPKVVARLNGGPRFNALIDSGSSINMVTRRVAEQSGYTWPAICAGPKLPIEGVAGNATAYCICSDMTIGMSDNIFLSHSLLYVKEGFLPSNVEFLIGQKDALERLVFAQGSSAIDGWCQLQVPSKVKRRWSFSKP
jgi:hypothetical protein